MKRTHRYPPHVFYVVYRSGLGGTVTHALLYSDKPTIEWARSANPPIFSRALPRRPTFFEPEPHNLIEVIEQMEGELNEVLARSGISVTVPPPQ